MSIWNELRRRDVFKVGADMGGNVREWVFNAQDDERFILGGAWDENLFSGLILTTTERPARGQPASNAIRYCAYSLKTIAIELTISAIAATFSSFMMMPFGERNPKFARTGDGRFGSGYATVNSCCGSGTR